jgi:flagellar protein FlaG
MEATRMSNDKLMVSALKPATALGMAQQRASAGAAKPEQAQPKPQKAAADIKQVAHRIDSYLKSVNRSLEFKVDNASGRTIVTVRDAENGELIRQIPNEEVLRFAELAEEQTVVLLNEKV